MTLCTNAFLGNECWSYCARITARVTVVQIAFLSKLRDIGEIRTLFSGEVRFYIMVAGLLLIYARAHCIKKQIICMPWNVILFNKALFVSYRSIQSLQRIGNNCNAVSDCPTSWSCKASCATSAREPSLPTAARTRRGSWSSRRVRSGYS